MPARSRCRAGRSRVPPDRPVKHWSLARDPVAGERLRRQPQNPGRPLRVQIVGVLRHSRLLVFDGPSPCTGRRGRMCRHRSEKTGRRAWSICTPPKRPPRRGLTRTGEDRTMTGRGAARPATTPHGRESPAPADVARGEPDVSRTAIRRDGTNVRKGGGPPSGAAGTPVRRSRSRRQVRTIPHAITRRSMDRSRSGRSGRAGA